MTIDEKFNVYGKIYGSGKTGKSVLLEGHLDTVFSFGTVTDVIEKDGKLYAPGICDDTRALAANLSVIRALVNSGLRPHHDIMIAGTAAEEGLGAMSGMKYLVNNKAEEILAAISIDGPSNDVMYFNATGMINYDVTYTGPGGHAYLAFGTPSAVQAMGRAIAALSDMQVPKLLKLLLQSALPTAGRPSTALLKALILKSICVPTALKFWRKWNSRHSRFSSRVPTQKMPAGRNPAL